MTLGWYIYTVERPDGCNEKHTVPIDDLKPHQLWAMCGCKPVEDVEAPDLWSHNAYDQRESYEQGRRLH